MKKKLKTIIRSVVSFSEEIERVETQVRARAYERYVARGSTHGHDVEDWLEATDQLLRHPEVSFSETETEMVVNFSLSEDDLDNIQLLVTDRAILLSTAKVIEAEKQIFSVVQFSRSGDVDSVRLDYSNGVLSCAVKVAREGGLSIKAVA